MYKVAFTQPITALQQSAIDAWNDAPFKCVDFSTVAFECEDGSVFCPVTHTWDAVRGTHANTKHESAKQIIDVKECYVVPGHCRGLLVWLRTECKRWNATPNHSATLRGVIRHGRQVVQMVAFQHGA